MNNETILDKLVDRLTKITEEVMREPTYQDDLEREVSDVGILLSGLEVIVGLLKDTFNDIDATLLDSRMDQEENRRRLQDSLATVSTILINYEVFVKLDIQTVKMFLENIDQAVLKTALADMNAEVINNWCLILLGSIREGDDSSGDIKEAGT